ncbi:hypothetical protein [Microlunatus sp. Gsoil 973]|jgi:hypothetical protein|uniref:hypothetical protein n=1 Tax=Microlunatus sp. Gsoil 973 TaxID=2672569 RepID=UPI0012B4D3B8|nr:hypothetical protein [Microlunatus sp. Gsoil 973]QGN32556.1 hypothetical protein GJV80_06800 [Microlunatus sp. Gsoil 973]
MTTTHHRRVAAGGLVLGPLLFTLADLLRRLIEPTGINSATTITRAVDQHRGAWLAAGLLSVASAYCFVAGVAGLITTASGRGARFTTVGAVLTGIGAVASVGHAVAFYSPYALYDTARITASDIEALDRASETSPLLIAIVVLFMIGMMVGPVILLFGMLRGRRTPVWSFVAAIVFVACGSTSGAAAGVLAIAAALAAFIPAARSLTAPSPIRLQHPAVQGSIQPR